MAIRAARTVAIGPSVHKGFVPGVCRNQEHDLALLLAGAGAAQAEMTFYGLAEFAVKVQDNIWDVIESSSRISIAGWVLSSAVST